jgi:hypothetical protein
MRKKNKDPWFCARESGLSYYPVSWQGYAVMVAYVALLGASSLVIVKSWTLFFILAGVLTVLMFVVVGATSGEN